MVVMEAAEIPSAKDQPFVGLTLDGIWEGIRKRNLYAGQPRSKESVEALGLAKTALRIASRTKSKRDTAQACRMMALTLNANGQYFASIRYYRRALRYLDGLGHTEESARTRLGFIAALGMVGRYDEAALETDA